MSARRNLILTLIIISPFIVLSGEVLWQSVLIDLFGKRDVGWCVNKIMDDNLLPKVEKSLSHEWTLMKTSIVDDAVPQEIIFYATELTSAMQDVFFTDEYIDELALQTTQLTSCKNIDTVHWQVRVSINDAIDAASWDMINKILEESYDNP